MLTVLIASRNGAGTLKTVLPAYCQLVEPAGGWKVVIIDDGSSDETKAVVSSFETRLPLTYLFEPARGKNAALNLGLQCIEGDLVVFSDDDTIPEKDWLTHMRATADANSSYSIFAGRVKPRWEHEPPLWMLDWVPMGPTFTISDPRLTEGPTDSCNVFGPNMAVRRNVFDAGHLFCASIGPKGKSYPMGSETEFVRRMIRAGFRCWYCPKSVVEHMIGSEHMDWSWILGRAVRYGRGQYRLDFGNTSQQFPGWFGIPRFLFSKLVRDAVKLGRSVLKNDRKERFVARWDLNFTWGQLVEARQIGIDKMDV
jgi:GT2 family glycosyltransferase